jgi:hypothetical protein
MIVNVYGINWDVEFYYFAGDPGRMYGHPDSWEPAEPGEFYLTSMKIDNNELIDLVRGETLRTVQAEVKKLIERREEL